MDQRRKRKMAAALAAVTAYLAEEQERPSRWARSGRSELMQGRQRAIARRGR